VRDAAKLVRIASPRGPAIMNEVLTTPARCKSSLGRLDVANHAVAVAMVQGPQAGLELLSELEEDSRVATHHRLDAVRASCGDDRRPSRPRGLSRRGATHDQPS
jgi:hypothetical protein